MQPFEATRAELVARTDAFVDAVFADLSSEFMVMPRGEGFVDYAAFAAAYERLKLATGNFAALDAGNLFPVLREHPLGLVVLRAMLGFTPSEWAYVSSEPGGIEVTQGFARTLDREIRLAPASPLSPAGKSAARVRAMIAAACRLLREGAPATPPRMIHRQEKADTRHGLESVRHLAGLGAPYAMLLYERFLGRPFAGHRDSVSELVGDGLESAIETVLAARKIPFRKTKRAERLPGFDQAPDFVIPDEFNPRVVIEAKITEDDGTARDKVTRVQHLAGIAQARKFELIACIGGRGFKVRREDMRKLLLATDGKVFTARSLDRLVANTGLRDYAT